MDYKLACEYREVAVRSEHLRASEKTQREIELVLDALEAVAEPVLVCAKIRPLSEDPGDDMVLDIAINGLADAIVTLDTSAPLRAGSAYRSCDRLSCLA